MTSVCGSRRERGFTTIQYVIAVAWSLVLLVLEGHDLAEPWTDTYFARAVELRLSEFPGVNERFAVEATSHRPHLHYVVLRAR